MAFPKLTKTPIAVNSRSNNDLSCQHITTSDFLQFSVSKIIPIVPHQSISVDHECFMRMDPLPIPTFGRCNVFHRAFFVPTRTIFTPWDDFINDTPHYFLKDNTTSIVSNVPCLANDIFILTLADTEFSTLIPFESNNESDNASDISGADFLYSYTTDSVVRLQKRKFTALGRWSYRLLRSLGYNFNWSNLDTSRLSLLPLFTCMRIYYDFFYPSQYINDSDSSFILSILTREKPEEGNEYHITENELRRILKIMYNIPYAQDYFTSAWDNPSAPTSNMYSSVRFPDTSVESIYETDVNVSSNGTPILQGGSEGTTMGTPFNISKYIVTALNSLTDYMKRHQIAGSRALDRYLSRWGVKLPNESLKRCIMLDEWSHEIQFGDVTSTASTDSAGLGYYAGKAISYGTGSTEFTSEKEYGYFVIVSTVVPVVQYYQGINKHCTHLTKLDFFTPEFDCLGTQAVSSKELYCTLNGAGYDVNYNTRVFGFLPRYAEYKVPYSQLTGDLSLNSFDVSNSGWTLFRDIQPFVGNNAGVRPDDYDIEHSLDFVMATDNEQYNRIFYNTDSDADHFKVVHTFRIKSSFPGKSLWDDYEFESEDKASKVTMKVNGSSVD